MRIWSEVTSMTDAEEREAMQRLMDDYFNVFHGDLYCGAAVEDLNKMLMDEIIRLYLDLDYEERKPFLNVAFWQAIGINDAKITKWNWLDNSGPTLSRYAMYCQARQEWNHQPDFGYCLVGNGTEDRGAENRRAENKGAEGANLNNADKGGFPGHDLCVILISCFLGWCCYQCIRLNCNFISF